MVAVVVLLAVSWQIPAPGWACGWGDNSSRCAATVQLEPTDLGFDPWIRFPGSIALSPDGSQVAVAMESSRESGESGSWTDAVVVFETATGAQLTTLVKGEDIIATELHYSADGTMIAAGIITHASGEPVGELHVYDTDSGDLLHNLQLPSTGNLTALTHHRIPAG